MAVGILLGLFFYAVDLREAAAQKEAAEKAADRVRRQDSHGTIWFTGHWGFQFYAEKAGMKPLVPWFDEGPPASALQPGDCLVIPSPETRLHQQPFRVDPASRERVRLQPVADLPVEDPFRLQFRTVVGFYGGRTPLDHHEGPRLRVHVFRITAGQVPRP